MKLKSHEGILTTLSSFSLAPKHIHTHTHTHTHTHRNTHTEKQKPIYTFFKLYAKTIIHTYLHLLRKKFIELFPGNKTGGLYCLCFIPRENKFNFIVSCIGSYCP